MAKIGGIGAVTIKYCNLSTGYGFERGIYQLWLDWNGDGKFERGETFAKADEARFAARRMRAIGVDATVCLKSKPSPFSALN
jgi:hypothetical protein